MAYWLTERSAWSQSHIHEPQSEQLDLNISIIQNILEVGSRLQRLMSQILPWQELFHMWTAFFDMN